MLLVNSISLIGGLIKPPRSGMVSELESSSIKGNIPALLIFILIKNKSLINY